MKRHIIKWYILLLTLTMILREVESGSINVTNSDENRHPRVTGRIVKLYSGSNPEPITCTDEGFRADPVDCSIFYRCIKTKSGKYSVLRFQCGPGTVYDTDTEVCNHPHNTKRSECRSYRPYQFFIAPIEQTNENELDSSAHEFPSPITSQKPLIMDRASSVGSSSTQNLYYSTTPFEYRTLSSIGETQKTMEQHQRHEITKATEPLTSKTFIVSTSHPWTTSVFGTNQHKPDFIYSTSEQDENKCTHDGFMGDNIDCRKFYRCVNNQRGGFTRYEFMCSETTIWDDDMQNCNHPWAVRRRRCARDVSAIEHYSHVDDENYGKKNKTIAEDKLLGHNVQKPSTIGQTNSTFITSTHVNYGDRISFDKVTNVLQSNHNLNVVNNQYLSDTESFMPGKERQQTQSTSYNADVTSKAQKQFHESITKSSTYVYSDYSTSYSTNKAKDIICTESGFIGDPNDCRKFYRCVQDSKGSYTKHEFLCGEGTAWDKQIESCNHAWLVRECGGKLVHDKSTTDKSYHAEKYSTTETNFISEGNPYSVGSYNLEQENGPLDISRVTTASPEMTEILLNPSTLDQSVETCRSPGYIGSKTNCKRFYRCIENVNGGYTKLEYICDDGTAWDASIEACNHAILVKNCAFSSKTETKLTSPSTESTIITTISFVKTTIQSSFVSNDNDVGLNVSYHKETVPNTTPTTTHNQCQENGFMADRYDCRKFYRCVENGNSGFIQFEYLCGDGTAWDSKISACNHLRAVETCGMNNLNGSTPSQQPLTERDKNVEGTTIQINNVVKTTESTPTINLANQLTSTNNQINVCNSSGFIGDSTNCKKFYRCVLNGDGNYTKYEFSCGEGTVWDPEIEACNHAGTVKTCGSILELQHEVVTSQSVTTANSINDELNNGYNNIEKSPPAQNSIQSSSEGTAVSTTSQECYSVGFLADKNDCKKFYRCVENGQGGFNRFEFSCGEGTAWDQSIEACNYITIVKGCEIINSNISSVVTTTQLGNLDDHTVPNYPQHEAQTTIKSTHLNNVCTAEGFYGNRIDCKRFYRCISDQHGGFFKYDFVCGEGTAWDQNIQACNHVSPDNINCTMLSSTNTNVTVIDSANSQDIQQNMDLNEKGTTVKHDDLSPNKDNTCFSEGFYPNLKDCKKFIRCVNNGEGKYIQYDFTCGEGTIWVQDIQACDHENDNSTCSSETSTVTESHIFTTTLIASPTTTPTEQNIIANNNHKPTESSESNILPSSECHSEGYYANPNDCRQFYRCVLDHRGTFEKYNYFCGEGTAWDIDTQTCNHISTVKRCKNAQEIQTTTLATNIVGVQTTEIIRTTKPTTKSPILTSEPTSVKDTSTTNECYHEGYYGNKENCQKFYRCVNNGQSGLDKYDYICGEGTIWDQDILACNHPKDVKKPSCNEKPKNTTSSVSTQPQSTETTSSSSHSTSKTTTSMPTIVSSSENTSKGTSNCSSSENLKNENITCTKAGYFPNPNNCKKFYRCVDWDGDGQRFSIFHFECGEGTIWDPALETCNYQDSVYPPRICGGSQIQNGSIASSTSTSGIYESTTTSMSTETTMQTAQTTLQQSSSTEPTTQQQSSTETTTIQSTPSTETTTQQQSSSETTTIQSTPITETTTKEQSSSETTTIQSNPSTESTTQQQSSSESTTIQTTASTEPTTQQESSSETTTIQSTSTTIEQSTTQQTTSTTEKGSSPQSTTDNISSSESTTSTTEQTTMSEATTTTTDQTSTTSEKAATTTELTTVTEQQSTTTSDQSSTPTSSTGLSTTTEETTTQISTTPQQTELSTENQSSSATTGESTANTSTTESTPETTTTESTSDKKCPNTESDQYLYACPTSFKQHPKYCNLFYQCLEDNESYELKIAVFKCPNGTIYDESKIQCVEENKAEKKCQGTIAKNRRFKRLHASSKEIITASRNSYGCSGIGHYPFEKNEECSPALLKCETSKSGKLRGFVYRCPENYVYWSISRKCEPISKMIDCKHSASQWAKRSEIPIERNNVAN